MRRRGSLSAMVVCLVPSIFVCAAMTIDGGRIVVAYQRASDVAAAAARDGAQEIVGIMEGSPRLDPVSADRSATSRVARLGHVGSATATEQHVTVTVHTTVQLPLLSLVGIRARSINVTRVADAVMG